MAADVELPLAGGSCHARRFHPEAAHCTSDSQSGHSETFEESDSDYDAEEGRFQCFRKASRDKHLAAKWREMLGGKSKPSSPDLQGNIYRYWAIGGNLGKRMSTLQRIGLICIVIVQVSAPIVLLFWASWKVQRKRWDWNFKPLAWLHEDGSVSRVTAQILGLLFLICFTLNGQGVIQKDRESWEALRRVMLKVDRHYKKSIGRTFNWTALYLSQVINSLIVMVCCVDMWLLLVRAADPFEAVSNAVALTFIYSLDDVTSDLSLLSEEDWPGHSLAQLADEQAAEGDQNTEWIPSLFYALSSTVVHILTIVLPFLFMFTTVRTEVKKADPPLELLQHRLNNVTAQLASQAAQLAVQAAQIAALTVQHQAG